jgi:hypothetical protein
VEFQKRLLGDLNCVYRHRLEESYIISELSKNAQKRIISNQEDTMVLVGSEEEPGWRMSE